MNAVLVPLVARREEPTLEGAAARASGVDVEAPRLDCSADEWHDHLTASARVSKGINRAGYPVREPTRATLLSATWPGGVFLLRPTLRKVRNRHKIRAQSVGVRAAGQLLGYVCLGIFISFRILLN